MAAFTGFTIEIAKWGHCDHAGWLSIKYVIGKPFPRNLETLLSFPLLQVQMVIFSLVMAKNCRLGVGTTVRTKQLIAVPVRHL